MDRSPKGRRGKVHLWAAFKDNSVIHFGTVWNKLVFSVGFGNARFWMNCGCYCCLAKPTVMLQIRCESLTPCLYQSNCSHPECEIKNKCDWLFLISVVVYYRSNRDCFAVLTCSQKLCFMWLYVILPWGAGVWLYLFISVLSLFSLFSPPSLPLSSSLFVRSYIISLFCFLLLSHFSFCFLCALFLHSFNCHFPLFVLWQNRFHLQMSARVPPSTLGSLLLAVLQGKEGDRDRGSRGEGSWGGAAVICPGWEEGGDGLLSHLQTHSGSTWHLWDIINLTRISGSGDKREETSEERREDQREEEALKILSTRFLRSPSPISSVLLLGSDPECVSSVLRAAQRLATSLPALQWIMGYPLSPDSLCDHCY